MRGHVLRYLGWQIWDRTGPRVLASWFIMLALTAAVHTGVSRGAPPDESLRQIMAQLHQQMVFISMILLTHGIVATDRTQGFFRFYFAKPVSPVWFYGQSLVLAFIGLIAASAGFVVFASWLIKPLWPWALVLNAIALFALFGLLMFVLSMVTRFDWLFLILIVVLSLFLRARWPADKGGAGRVLDAVLPPTHLIGWSVHPTTSQWLWLGGWSLGLFLLGLAILRFRPIGEG